MALAPINLYSAITLAAGATPSIPYSAAKQNPLSLTTVIGNYIVFNFVTTTGSPSPGIDASILLKFGFACSSYSPASTAPTILNPSSIQVVSLNAPHMASITQDTTTSVFIPVTGSYFYCWLDLTNFEAPVTFTANAVPVDSIVDGGSI